MSQAAPETIEVAADDLRTLIEIARQNTAEIAALREVVRILARAMAPLPPMKPSNRELLKAAVDGIERIEGRLKKPPD